MTVSTTTARVSYTGNGVTLVFAVPFPFIQDDYLTLVKLNATTLVETTLVLNSGGALGYTVSGAGEATGSVTLVSAPTGAEVLTIFRTVPATQESDFVANDPFPAEVFEDALDKLTMIVGQAVDDVDRALKLFDGDVDGSGRYDANGNRIVGLADGVNPSDAATVGQLIGAGSGNFIAAGTGAVTRTMQNKARDIISANDFGVVGDGFTDNSAAIQLAIAYCAANEAELVFTPGDYVLNTGLTHSSGSIKISGAIAGTQGTRFFIRANSPAFYITAQATIENIGIIGEQSGAKTLQAGIYIDNTNNVDVRNVVFDGCYDSIKLEDTCFYCTFQNIRWFSCVRAHVYGFGVTGPGYAIQFSDCQMTPSLGQYGFYLENAGSVVLSDVIMSPANLTERCFRLVSNATQAGLHQFNNVVFEGSIKESLRIEGTAIAPVRNMLFSNCYFNQAGASQDAITIVYGEYIDFVNSYISGTGPAAVTFAGDVRNISFTNTILPGAHTVGVFRGITGATLETVDINNPQYTGAAVFLDLSAVLTADISKVTISGGDVGTNAAPVALPNPALVSTDNWLTWTPGAPVPGAGTFTTASVSTARYRRDGRTVHVMFEVTITTNGTAAGSITVNLPIAAAQPAQLFGRERNSLGYSVTGTILSAGTTVLLKKYDDTYPGASNTIISMCGSYEVA